MNDPQHTDLIDFLYICLRGMQPTPGRFIKISLSIYSMSVIVDNF